MGQRLVISVTVNNDVLAKIYYHWSAYTICALDEAKKIIDTLGSKDWDSDKDMILDLIRFCENNGGGLYDNRELKYAKKLFPNETFKVDDISRNEGVIAITRAGKNYLQKWSEGDLILDFDDDGSVENSVCCWYEDLETLNTERSEWEEEPLNPEDIPSFDFSMTDFGFNEIDKVLQQLEGNFTYCKCLDGYYEISR